MSNLLEQASLVMIPSGYKEDIVYSVIPTSGAGDLTFTRASNGTRIDSNGNVEVVPWNLMPWSETFNFATGGWNLQNGATTVANSGTAPNGTNTATLLYPISTNVIVAPNRRAEPTTAPSTAIYTQYVYAKASGKNWLALYKFDGSSGTAAWFNLSTGVLGTVASGCTAFIESAGNGWYKCGFTQSVTAGSNLYMHIYPTDSDNTITVTASGTNGILIWGAQLNIGSTAKPYFPTTDRLNVPRLTYQNGGGGCPSLLLEKQSTNVLTQSNVLTGVSGTTATVNDGISPDGTQNAILISGTSGYAYAGASNNFGSGVTSTFSAFLKYKQGIGQASIGIGGAFSAYLYIDGLDDGNIVLTNYAGSGVSGVTTGYEVHANGWYRFWLTATYTGSPGYEEWQIATQGTNTQFWYYGGQNEASSYMTSYIPTSGTSATRVADACYKTGISSLIGQTEGTIFLDFVFKPQSNITDGQIGISNSANSNRVIIWNNFTLNTLALQLRANGTNQISNVSLGSFVDNTHYKIAVAYKSGNNSVFVNGIEVIANTASFTFSSALTDFILGGYEITPSGHQQINQSVLFPTRLTNSELAQLTGNQNYTINQAYESYGVASESPNCVQP